MSFSLSESCKIIMESKDKEIDRLIEERNILEKKVEEYEMRETVIRVFLIIQAGLLAIAFQIWK